jgi:hypothetical protein
MKTLLQSFLLVALTLVLAQDRSFCTLPSTVHAAATPVFSSAQWPAPVAPIPPELRNQGDPDVPMKGSPLPLVSLIGFGLLIGGVMPAMRRLKITGTHP